MAAPLLSVALSLVTYLIYIGLVSLSLFNGKVFGYNCIKLSDNFHHLYAMEMKPSQLIIEDKGRQRAFELVDGLLPAKTLEKYYSNSVGLMFIKNGTEFLVNLNEKNQFIAPPEGMVCTVVYDEKSEKKKNNKVQDLEFEDILAEYKNGEKDKNSKKCNKKKISNQKVNHHKIIKLTWHHKKSSTSKAIAVSEPYGGTKQLHLDTTEDFPFDDIKELAIEQFKNTSTKKEFDKSIVNILNYKKNKIYDFFNEDMEITSMWECKDIVDTAGRIHLIVLTTEMDELKDSGVGSSKVSLSQEKKRKEDEEKRKEEEIKRKEEEKKRKEEEKKKDDEFYDNLPNMSSNLYRKEIRSSQQNATLSYKRKEVVENPSDNFPLHQSLSTNKNINNTFKTPCSDSFLVSSTTKNRKNTFKKPCSRSFVVSSTAIRKSDSSSSKPDSEFDQITLSVPQVEKEDLESTGIIIGCGAFGSVEKYRWNLTDVAVKKIIITSQNLKYTLRELKLTDQLKHTNIISLMGYMMNDEEVWLIMELFNGQSLDTLLFRKSEEEALIQETKLDIIQQLCCVINFLHMYKPPVIHKDLKPANILIDSHHHIKLIDFGFSKFESEMPLSLESTIGNNYKGTPCYMAPEVFIERKPATIYSDIWAVGCIIIETFNNGTNAWPFDYTSLGAYQKLVCCLQNQNKPDLSNVPLDLQLLVEGCFDYIPQNRPSAKELFALVDRYKKKNF